MKISLATIAVFAVVQFANLYITSGAVTFDDVTYDVIQKTSSGRARAPSIQEVMAALTKAREINALKKEVKMLGRQNNEANRRGLKCPLSLHHGTRHHDNTNAGTNANDAILALRILMTDNGYSLEDIQNNTLAESLKSINGFQCDAPKAGRCDFRKKYRNVDGSCNNRANPDWGMAGSIQQRVLPNHYDDKMSAPRTKGSQYSSLPNARTVSNIVHRNLISTETLSNRFTLHVMGFGQFLDHDIARTPEQDDVADCCETAAQKDIDNCFSIIVPRGSVLEKSDIIVPGFCMEVKRSAPLFCPDDTSRGQSIRQQTTSLTSFVDASNVYGSSESRLAELREKKTGYRMATDFFRNQERILSGPDDTCTLQDSKQKCSAAGDGRVNEVPTLTSYHFLFVKEHNRIADVLKDYYNNNETIFQETRRIVIAIMQKIVYDEFLAAVFSPRGYIRHNLQSSAKYVYEPSTNPTMLNAFGIAFRVGHTWIPQEMRLFSRMLKEIRRNDFNRKTENTFNNPDLTFEPLAFPRLAYYMSGRQSPKTDRIIEEAVRSRLFINREENIAFDLAALNIQRGRDHGLPSYNEYRKWCGLSSVSNTWFYSGLVDHTLYDRIRFITAGYKSPRDIDLFAGGLTEKPVVGGRFGPTFECIIGRQFRRLKFGDRFWYQNTDAQFTKSQITAIERYSLSRIFCNNYNFREVHFPNVFVSVNVTSAWSGHYVPGSNIGYFPNKRSTLTRCEDIPDLDLYLFKPSYVKKSLPQPAAASQADEYSVPADDTKADGRINIEEDLKRILDKAIGE